jgi:zinc D-Ala-D-Ala carboxypeptidase
VSEHFTLAEFLYSDTADKLSIKNTPTWTVVDNLARLANTMERVRKLLGSNAISISSGYRCPAVNQAVGGALNSAHLDGLACDFTCPKYGTPEMICKVLQPHLVELDVDQLIWEFGSWVHLGLAIGSARHMALTIDNGGTRTGFA